MSHVLPVAGSPLREMFEISDLVAIATGERAVPTVNDAMHSAKRFLKGNEATKAVIAIVLQADDTLALFRFGARGGRRRLWVFGKATRSVRVA